MAQEQDLKAAEKIAAFSKQSGIDVATAKIRRTSSRFCLGVEHGDYNGTELFGVGTDRFIWLAFKPNGTNKIRLFSGNFPDDGVVQFPLGKVPEPRTVTGSWARFPYGVEYILRREGISLRQGIDGVLWGDIPGGGMSRSASLTLNLILSLLDANNINLSDNLKIIDMAQAVENDYIGSPCGQLDQIMILFAKENRGTHYDPATRSINYIPLGESDTDLRIVVLDTGTDRPGLEKSTYKVRREECEKLVSLAQKKGMEISALADIKTEEKYRGMLDAFQDAEGDLCDRMTYIFNAQNRFYTMLEAWKTGDVKTVGALFRADGIGLRDVYKISGPELETMCDIARTVPGVLGERMLGGGDKGAAGALVEAGSADALKQAVETAYPRSRSAYADKFAVHTCKVVEGVTTLGGLL